MSTTTSGPEYDHDVLVVGTGPTGAATALALADQGIDVLVISKFNWLSPHAARAHHEPARRRGAP